MNLTFKSKNLEMSLMAPDLTTSVFGSSCNYLMFGLILSSFLSLSLSLHSIKSKEISKVPELGRDSYST